MRQHWERNCRIAAVLVTNLRDGRTKGMKNAARVLDLHPAYVGHIAKSMWIQWHRGRHYGCPGWQQWLSLSPDEAWRWQWRHETPRPLTAIAVERHGDAHFRYDEQRGWKYPAAPKSFDDWWDERPVKNRKQAWLTTPS